MNRIIRAITQAAMRAAIRETNARESGVGKHE
jgi:hypothetical protein